MRETETTSPSASQGGRAAPQMVAACVDADISCRSCGYNLRTLATDALWPECGVPVDKSVNGNHLKYCNPVWVRKLATGVRLIRAATPFVFVGVVSHRQNVFGMGSITNFPVTATLALIGVLCFVTGCWIIAKPDPSGDGAEYGVTRKMVLAFIAVLLLESLLFFYDFSTFSPKVSLLIQTGIGNPVGIVGLIGLYPLISLLGHLASRIPDRGLVVRANYLKFLLPIACVVCRIMYVVTDWIGFHRAGSPNAAIGYLVGVTELTLFGCFVVLFMCNGLVRGLLRGFVTQAALARQNWQSTHQP